MENKNIIRRITDKLFGGLSMSWLFVILFAAATAVLTAVFLIVPVFEKTSFHRMGVFLEAWIFFAVIIMSNCKNPLESALKTFVFFLISQPLIYLLQVPFNEMGWHIFAFYRYWFFWTLATFPMAFVGWYIRRKNWLSLLILSPVLVFLTYVYFGAFRFSFNHFPYRIVTGLFCLAQVALYLYVFTPKLPQRLIGFFVPSAVILAILLLTPELDLRETTFLPDDPVLTNAAVVESGDHDIARISIVSTGKDSIIEIKASKYGSTEFTVKDGDITYRYRLEIYEDDQGHPQTKITLIK